MPNVLTANEMFCNAALVRIGYKLRIGSLFDGSEQSKVCLDIFGQTRDQLLRSRDWDFARKTGAAIPGPAPGPGPWLFQFLYPPDCIRVRDIYGLDYVADPNDPLPDNWTRGTTIINGLETEAVLANISPITLVYTQQVTDPALWDEGFGESLIDTLAMLLAPALADLNAAKMMAELATAKIAEMADLQG